MKFCQIPECGEKYHCNDLCKQHYEQKYREDHREALNKKARENYYKNRESRIAKQKLRYHAQTPAEKQETARKKRNYNLAIKYQLTPEEFQLKLASQNSKCAICPRTFTAKLQPVVDHCHDTGKVRGLLCSPCNIAIGLLGESRESLFSAFNYLEDHTLGIKR